MNPTVQTKTASKEFPSLVFPRSHAKRECAHCGSSITDAFSFSMQDGCQENLPQNDPQESPSLNFCCRGCERVYSFLKKRNFSNYYKLLEGLTEHAPQQTKHTSSDNNAFSHVAMAQLFETSPGNLKFFVPDLRCAACIWLLEKAISSIEGVQSFDISLLDRTVSVVGTQDKMSTAKICGLLQDLGYRPYPPEVAGWDEGQRGLSRKSAKELVLSGALFANVMMLAVGTYYGDLWGMDTHMRRFFVLIMFALGSLSLFLPGSIFFRTAWSSLKAKKLNMDLPIAFALAITYMTSVWGVLKNSGDVYFDSISGLIFLLLSARALHEYQLSRARRLASFASALLPERSLMLKPGDVTLVSLGEHFPADGIVLEGSTEANEAALTGESRSVPKEPGDQVLAGTQNMLSPVKIEVLRVGADSYVGKLMDLVKSALLNKSEFQVLSEKILPYFVLFTFASAAIAAVLWSVWDPHKAPAVLATVLIVACPCAIALSVPLTLTAAMNRAWKAGFVIKGSSVLEKLCKINAVVIDKTGTLTLGEMEVVRIREVDPVPVARSEESAEFPRDAQPILMAAALCMSRRSAHPISQAIRKNLELRQNIVDLAAKLEDPKTTFQERIGQGIEAYFPTLGSVRLGSEAFVRLEQQSVDHLETLSRTSATTVYLRSGSQSVSFELQDSIRKGVPAFLNRLCGLGMDVHIASGDTHFFVGLFREKLKALGTETEKITFHSECSPNSKMDLIRRLKGLSQDKQVVMMGDGVNDAPSLALADVGLALGRGLDVALNAADVLCLSNDPCGFTQLLSFAQDTATTLRWVVATSICYNVAAVGLACAGVLHPLVAALIMPLSSVSTALIVYLRKGENIWRSCTFSSPLRSSLLPAESPSSSKLWKVGNLTT